MLHIAIKLHFATEANMQNPIVLNRADASGQGPRYFLGSEDYVVDKGLLESFIRLGNERGDLASLFYS